ncbi:MAG: hypothetical protein GVY32_12650 [Gammaproteobacteria bacterium]|jgi:uncharacterized delta-60 repeat protein|nr:hypothetical protein [Gammaproteobacteria bacterium]
MAQQRISMLTSLIVLAVGIQVETSRAQIGSLDPQFNGTGTVTHPVAEWALANAVSLAPDGSVTLIGHAEDNGNPANRSGTLTIFDPDGTLVHSQVYPAGAFGCSSVPRAFLTGTRVSNGDLIAAGYRQTTCSGSPRVFEIFRTNAGGGVLQQYDPAVFYGEIAYAYAVAVQSDGKVVSAGFADQTSFEDTSRDIALARHNADGTLDTGFGNEGEIMLDITGDEDRLTAVAVLDNGKILAGGMARSSDDRDFLLLRFEADGTLDSNFGMDGVVTHDLDGYDDRIWDFATMPDGRILVAGDSIATDGVTRRFTLARFNPDGSLDTDFAVNGTAFIEFGGPVASAQALRIGPSGRIYAAGQIEIGSGETTRQVAVAVMRSDGTQDPAFGTDGTTVFDFGVGPIDQAKAIDIDPMAGRIAVGGYSGETDSEGDRFWQIAAARLIGFPDALFADRFQ